MALLEATGDCKFVVLVSVCNLALQLALPLGVQLSPHMNNGWLGGMVDAALEEPDKYAVRLLFIAALEQSHPTACSARVLSSHSV